MRGNWQLKCLKEEIQPAITTFFSPLKMVNKEKSHLSGSFLWIHETNE